MSRRARERAEARASKWYCADPDDAPVTFTEEPMAPIEFIAHKSFGRKVGVDAMRVTHWEQVDSYGEDPGVRLHIEGGATITVAGNTFDVAKRLLDAKRAAGVQA